VDCADLVQGYARACVVSRVGATTTSSPGGVSLFAPPGYEFVFAYKGTSWPNRLSLSWIELQQEVGWFLNAGRTIGSFTAAQLTAVTNCVQSGVRKVYYPPAVDQSTVGYEWSWLRPTETIDFVADYGTGTVTVASGVVTLTSGTFPSWAASGVLSVGGGVYPVDTRDGDTQVTLVDTSLTIAAASAYAIGQEDYTLPDNFGRIMGEIHWPTDEYRTPLEQVSIGKILAMRGHSERTGPPRWFAIRYKSSDGATGQRQELMIYPRSDIAKTMNYQYEAYSGVLTDALPYPLGGMQLAELYTESCLAVAELRMNDEEGLHTQQYQRLLIDAVARDRRRSAAVYGNMGHVEERGIGIMGRSFRRGYTGTTYPITYNGNPL